jgi:NAD(P)-dependent dehydrogenase (short-subunit alcohol dehydrogenase family)
MSHSRVALVTGALGGIGRAVVAVFADAGFETLGVDREPGADVVAELSQTDGARAAVSAVVERHARLDAVVLAHGVSGRMLGDGPVADCTDEAWDAVLDANLRSVFNVCRESVRVLVESGGGAIVAVGSVLGLVGGDEDFATHAYAASKAGVVGLIRAIAVAYAHQGVRASVVAPGLIETPMSRRAQEDPRIRGRLAELQPLTGALGRPEDVARAALYLAEAEFVTGVVLPVDAGWTAK